jgi:phage protein D/phage baseplate assembly protein gpV
MPEQERFLSQFFVRVNGNDLESELMDELLQVVVDSNLHLPDMFVIRVHDESLKWIEEGPFELGASVEIGAVTTEGGSEEKLISGEITALEPDFNEGTQAFLTVRGYDRSHRLHRGTRSCAFVQMTDSDLATRIAQEAGLRADVDSTSQVYEHVLQDNQSEMDFLRSRAKRIGYEAYTRDETLYFKKPGGDPGGTPLGLEWGDKLKAFRPRLTLAEQIDEMVVKGWDPKTKTEVTGSATSSEASPEIGETQSGAELASEAFGDGKQIVVHQPVTSQAEADAVAQALYDEVTGSFIQAEGTCKGLPQLMAGTTVELSALGQTFNGKYFVTSAIHTYSAGSDYETRFTVHGRRPGTLFRLLASAAEEKAPRWSGVVTAIVTNNNDDQDQGRVKLKYPWLDDDVESGWARVIGAGAGNERGAYCLPEVNDEVLVAFEHGNTNRPMVLGGLWNGVDKPPSPASEAVKDGQVRTRVFKTRTGHTLTFVDESQARVLLETAGGHSLLLDDENTLIQLETSGGAVLKLDDSDGSVSLSCNGKVSVDAQQEISLKAGTDLKLEATGRVTVKGAMIELN